MTTETQERTLNDDLVELRKINHWMAKANERATELRYEIKSKLEKSMQINTGHEGVQTVAEHVSIDGKLFKLQVEQKINRSVDQKKVLDVIKLLPKTVAASLFKTKYDLSVAAFKKLTPDNLTKAQDCVKVSAGIPTIKLVPVDEAE